MMPLPYFTPQIHAVQLDHFFCRVAEAVGCQEVVFYGGVAVARVMDAAVWEVPCVGVVGQELPEDVCTWTPVDIVRGYKRLAGWTALTEVCGGKGLQMCDMRPSGLYSQNPTEVVMLMEESWRGTWFHKKLRREMTPEEENRYAWKMWVREPAQVIPLPVRVDREDDMWDGGRVSIGTSR